MSVALKDGGRSLIAELIHTELNMWKQDTGSMELI